MKRNKTWMMMTVGVALMSLAACSTDDNEASNGSAAQQLEIHLSSSSIVADTRSYTATNLQNGDTVYVWTAMVNGSTGAVSDYFNAWTLMANGVGGLTPQSAGNTKLFPATNALNFYAMVGNFGLVTEGPREGLPMIESEVAAIPATGILHTVNADQTTATAYFQSDLLYAVKKNQEPIAEAVQLPFIHMLSRIQVVLVAGNGITASDLTANTTSVKLHQLERQVIFRPDTALNYTLQASRAAMLALPAQNEGQIDDILMTTNVVGSNDAATDPGSTVYADAIIVPQTVAAGTTLLKVSYLGRDTEWKVPAGGLTFESGKQYRFRLTADRIGETYELSSVTMESWGANTTEAAWFDTITSEENKQ